jgi:hypothetical protein
MISKILGAGSGHSVPFKESSDMLRMLSHESSTHVACWWHAVITEMLKVFDVVTLLAVGGFVAQARARACVAPITLIRAGSTESVTDWAGVYCAIGRTVERNFLILRLSSATPIPPTRRLLQISDDALHKIAAFAAISLVDGTTVVSMILGDGCSGATDGVLFDGVSPWLTEDVSSAA